MKTRFGSLYGRVALRFDAASAYAPADLSAAARAPDGALVVAADERAAIEVLRAESSHVHLFGDHRSFSLSDALGVSVDDEVDIEGLAFDEEASALFVVGSHSAARKKPRGKGHAADLERLATVKTETSRFVLARVALAKDGSPALARKGKRGVCMLPAEGERSLLGTLAGDAHLGPFLPTPRAKDAPPPIPGKDNGFDIEGLACFEDRLLIGLRGPVLRGWAFILDLRLEVGEGGELGVAAEGKRRYRKHALDLDGLGVRDLLVFGDDVFIVAGPTMTLDGAHRLFRWTGGPSAKADSVVAQKRGKLEPLFDLPYSPGMDRAEGVAPFSWFEEDDSILVVYDSPGEGRHLDDRTVLADVFCVR